MKKENKTIRKREKCSDCFYNGNCKISLTSCRYLKPQKIEEEK